MKHRLQPSVATFVFAAACWGASVFACEDEKNSTQAAASAHATCTASQAAACKAKSTSAVTTSTASATKATSVGCSHAKSAGASTVCRSKGADATTADHKGHGTDAYAAGGSSCSGRGYTAAIEKFNHSGCDACADMSLCDQELKSASSVAQVVKLKNGVMFIHTASNPNDVRAVQAAMMRRNERLNALSSAGDKVKLCPDCKVMRGAIASGKLSREMVAIEGGCLTLMTSNDAGIVKKLHALATEQTSARVKI